MDIECIECMAAALHCWEPHISAGPCPQVEVGRLFTGCHKALVIFCTADSCGDNPEGCFVLHYRTFFLYCLSVILSGVSVYGWH